MTELTSIRCVACEGGIPALSQEEVQKFLSEIKNWTVCDDGKAIRKKYDFKNFYKTMAFVNAVAWVANQENHHPDMELGFNYCVIKYQTHAINGLTQNDFICAAKIDRIETI